MGSTSGESPAAGITAFKERLDKELGGGYSFFDTLDSVKQNLQSELEHTPEVRELLKVEDGKGILNGKELPSLESMKTIKVFLASSIVEFKHERMKLGDFVRSLNDHYVGQDIYFKLRLCNDLPRAVANEGKRDEYNQEIRDSRFFYVIFGKEDYAAEEFDVALAQFRASGAPKVFTYFRKLPEGESPAASVTAFMKRLEKEIDQYYKLFEHLDSVKLDLLIELTQTPEVNGLFKVEEMLDDKELLSLENVLLFSKNKKFVQLKAERDRLNDKVTRIREEYDKNHDSTLFVQLLEADGRLNKVNEQFRRLERDMLKLCKTIAEQNSSGRVITLREKKASTLLDEGEYEKALAVLRAPEREKELEQAELVADAGLDRIRNYIDEDRLLIDIWKAKGVNQETISKILKRYEKCADLAKKQKVAVDILYEYASFLEEQKDYDKALGTAEWLHTYYQLDKPSDAMLARLKNLLGVLHGEKRHFSDAEKYCREALVIYRSLVEAHPASYEAGVADICHNLATLLMSDTKRISETRISEAEELFREALAINRSLTKVNPAAYLEVASACDSLAMLLSDTDRISEAEEFYREALAICRRLAEANPAACEAYVAKFCNNLAKLLKQTGRISEAEELFREALAINHHLTKVNLAAYEAKYWNNLAALLGEIGRISEAEELFREALAICRRLAEANPAAYEEGEAMLCHNLAILLRQTGRPDEAEALRRKAESIRQHLGLE